MISHALQANLLKITLKEFAKTELEFSDPLKIELLFGI
jgi:hypothetical protein